VASHKGTTHAPTNLNGGKRGAERRERLKQWQEYNRRNNPVEATDQALKWLNERGGDACFDKHGVAFAQGETAPFMRSTWNKLRDADKIEFYGGVHDGGSGYGRLRVKNG
jgi:hypothetical protein